MTEQEYRTQKADLEAQLAALEQEWATTGAVVEYPKWVYHETEGSQIVNSAEEEAALGAGWSASPGGPAIDQTAKKSSDKAKVGEAKVGKASDDDKKSEAGRIRG